MDEASHHRPRRLGAQLTERAGAPLADLQAHQLGIAHVGLRVVLDGIGDHDLHVALAPVAEHVLRLHDALRDWLAGGSAAPPK
jgi:hypothetical protein